MGGQTGISKDVLATELQSAFERSTTLISTQVYVEERAIVPNSLPLQESGAESDNESIGTVINIIGPSLSFDTEQAAIPVRCIGTVCRSGSFDFSIGDIFSEYDAVGFSKESFSTRGGFDTFEGTGTVQVGGETSELTEYGFWGEYGGAVVETADGPTNVTVAYAFGVPSNSNPDANGSATWTGIAEAASRRSYELREGTVTVSIPNFSDPHVNVEVMVDDYDIPAWEGVSLAKGSYTTGTSGSDYLAGSFFGTDHSETYGVFDIVTYVGAFGAKRD